MENFKIYKSLSGLQNMKWSITGKGILTGFVSGLLVVFYRIGIEYGTETSLKIYTYLKDQPLMILPWMVLLLLLGIFVYWLLKLEPMASGSGIPQVKGIVLYGFKIKWYFILLVRFLAGILSAFTGVSLGREGPSIQIGASGSQAAASKISKNKLEENYLITGGAAAGLSAAFNAPLSGIVFALEEVHRSFSPLVLIAATTASLTADVVSKYFFGLKPVLSYVSIPQLPVTLYIWLLPLGLLSGVLGAFLNKALLQSQVIYQKLPPIIRPFLAFMIAVPCGLFLPQVLGGGQNLIRISEEASTGILMLSVFLVVKLIFTCTSFGSGIPGGIFMPILTIGALFGSLFGVLLSATFVPGEYIAVFCVCAMAGALSGSVKAPVTSILLMAEMTGSLVHLLPVAACSFIALLSSDLLKVPPIYEALLERTMKNNSEAAESHKQGALLEIPVEIGSDASGRKISDISWPKGSLVAGVHRGDGDIIPNGNTVLLPGDYLVIVSSDRKYRELNSAIRALCHSK